jgi:hypothetical protein
MHSLFYDVISNSDLTAQNDELDCIWKETDLANSKHYPENYVEVLRKTKVKIVI